METGYDILFFWVARMIVMGIEDTGEIPFRFVYLHGLIRDEKGEKMSKTRGNVVDPLETLEKYGTDALRFAITTGTSPGNDLKLSMTKMEAGRNFANKLWNATRFLVRSIEPGKTSLTIKPKKQLPLEDRWILSRLNRTIAEVARLMEEYQLGEAERTVHDFLWGEYCDWYIELAKVRLRASEEISPLPVLIHVLETSLRLLHPFMPFITEELWQNLRKRLPPDWQRTESIMIAAYPEADASTFDDEAERVMTSFIDIIRAIRNTRAEYKVAENRWVEAQIYAAAGLTAFIAPYTETIQTLAKAKPVTFLTSRPEKKDNSVIMVLNDAEVAIPMASMIDREAESKRLQKEIEGSEAEIGRLKARLDDPDFLAKAPAAVVAKERQKLLTVGDRLKRLKEQMEKL